MGITIDNIADNEYFEYKGDVRVKNSIGKNATVIIKDGSLTVDGNVDDATKINVIQEANNMVISSGVFVMNNITIGNMNGLNVANVPNRNLHVQGNVGNGVHCESHNADFSVNGSVGNQCKFKTHSGDITTGNVGENTFLITHNGNVSTQNVGKQSSLKSHNGNIKAHHLDENTSATTHNGNVKVTQAATSAVLKTVNGSVYENGVKCRKENARNHSVFSMGNMSVVGGGSMNIASNGRVVVNGVDVTDIVNGNNANTSNTTSVVEEETVVSNTGCKLM